MPIEAIFKRPMGVGEALGTGLGEGIRSLAESKMQQMQQEKERQNIQRGLSALEGITPEQAEQYSYLPKEYLAPILKENISTLRRQKLGNYLNNTLAEGGDEAFNDVINSLPETEQLKIHKLNLDRAKQKYKEEQDLRRLETEEKRFNQKETAPFRNEIYNSADGAKEDLMSLDALQELNNTGKIDPAWFAGIKDFLTKATGFEFNIGDLSSPETEAFNKIVQGFLKNAKKNFGSKVTEGEIRMFMKTLPTLQNSQEGRRRILKMMKEFSKAKIAKEKVLNKIMRENQGIPLDELRTKLDKGMKPVHEKMGSKISSAIKGANDYARKETQSRGPVGIFVEHGLEATLPDLLPGERYMDKETGRIITYDELQRLKAQGA